MQKLNKNDYNVLIQLYDNNCLSEIRSYSVESIAARTKLSIAKIRKTITLCIDLGYVSEGARDNRKKRYYLNPDGVVKMKKELGIEEIKEEVILK